MVLDDAVTDPHGQPPVPLQAAMAGLPLPDLQGEQT